MVKRKPHTGWRVVMRGKHLHDCGGGDGLMCGEHHPIPTHRFPHKHVRLTVEIQYGVDLFPYSNLAFNDGETQPFLVAIRALDCSTQRVPSLVDQEPRRLGQMEFITYITTSNHYPRYTQKRHYGSISGIIKRRSRIFT